MKKIFPSRTYIHLHLHISCACTNIYRGLFRRRSLAAWRPRGAAAGCSRPPYRLLRYCSRRRNSAGRRRKARGAGASIISRGAADAREELVFVPPCVACRVSYLPTDGAQAAWKEEEERREGGNLLSRHCRVHFARRTPAYRVLAEERRTATRHVFCRRAGRTLAFFCSMLYPILAVPIRCRVVRARAPAGSSSQCISSPARQQLLPSICCCRAWRGFFFLFCPSPPLQHGACTSWSWAVIFSPALPFACVGHLQGSYISSRSWNVCHKRHILFLHFSPPHKLLSVISSSISSS